MVGHPVAVNIVGRVEVVANAIEIGVRAVVWNGRVFGVTVIQYAIGVGVTAGVKGTWQAGKAALWVAEFLAVRNTIVVVVNVNICSSTPSPSISGTGGTRQFGTMSTKKLPKAAPEYCTKVQ